MTLADFSKKYHHGYNPVTGEYETFKLDPFQERFFQHINDNRLSLIKKPRQTFVSSMLATYVVWQLLHGTGTGYQGKRVILYASNKLSPSKNFLRKVNALLVHVIGDGARYKRLVEHDRSDLIVMKNGNEFMVRAVSPNSMRGILVDDLIIDEAAYVHQLENHLPALLPMISAGAGSKLILASTPNGMNYFYDLYNGAMRDYNGFEIFNIEWDDVSSRGKEWLEDLKRMLNHDEYQIDQELLAKFVTPKVTPPKKRKGKLVQVRLEDEVYTSLNARLIELGISQSEYLRMLMEEDLG